MNAIIATGILTLFTIICVIFKHTGKRCDKCRSIRNWKEKRMSGDENDSSYIDIHTCSCCSGCGHFEYLQTETVYEKDHPRFYPDPKVDDLTWIMEWRRAIGKPLQFPL